MNIMSYVLGLAIILTASPMAEAAKRAQPRKILLDEPATEGGQEPAVMKKPETQKTPPEEKKPMTPDAKPGLKEITTASGLKYIDWTVGTGESPMPGAMVIVHYTGMFPDGKKFDSSVDRKEPFSFPIGMGDVIKGWDEGVMSMKVGGKRKLIVPPHLGYGKRGAGNVIPPDATLWFEVELLEVKSSQK